MPKGPVTVSKSIETHSLLVYFYSTGRKMPFKKKNEAQRGRPREKGGYKSLSKDETAEYHLTKMRESRSKAPKPPSQTPEQPNSRADRSMNRAGQASCHGDTVESSEPTSSKVGRPPVSGETAMTPNTRRNRKTIQAAKRRHTKSVSQTRLKVAKTLWTERKSKNSQNVDDSSDEEESNSTNDDSDADGSRSPNQQDDETEPSDQQDFNAEGDHSRAQLYRHQSALRGTWTYNNFDNLRFLQCYLTNIKFTGSILDELNKIVIDEGRGNLSVRQIRYKVTKLKNSIKNPTDNDTINLIKYWLGLLLDHPEKERLFDDASIDIDEQYIPLSLIHI